TRIIAHARLGHACLLAADAFGDGRWRVDGCRWHAIDPLLRPVTRSHCHTSSLATAVRAGNRDDGRALLVAPDAKHHAAIAGGPQCPSLVFDDAARRHLADHHRTLL